MNVFQTNELTSWFLKFSRILPWRENKSPYRIWISEVMLQQTQSSVVIPYFHKWMKQFPSVESLASASIEEVTKAWEGLGYYQRARNLHTGAKQIVTDFKGLFPQTREELQKIKGLGPYTVGAILAFAFEKKAAALDGNAIRVLSRYFLIEDPVDKTKTKNELWSIAEQILPDEKPFILTEALIELGANICQKRPKCNLCPIQKGCKAFAENKQELIPIKSAKTTYVKLNRIILIIEYGDQFLIQEVTENLMKGLCEFPYFSFTETHPSINEIELWIKNNLRLSVDYIESGTPVMQSFTKYRVLLYPYRFKAHEKKDHPLFSWVVTKRLNQLPFSSGHRKIKGQIFS